jgi:hypothetical protein
VQLDVATSPRASFTFEPNRQERYSIHAAVERYAEA